MEYNYHSLPIRLENYLERGSDNAHFVTRVNHKDKEDLWTYSPIEEIYLSMLDQLIEEGLINGPIQKVPTNRIAARPFWIWDM